MENRYDFIPMETNEAAAERSLSQLCARTVKDVAKARLRDAKDADKIGKSLKEYRDYAIENRKPEG